MIVTNETGVYNLQTLSQDPGEVQRWINALQRAVSTWKKQQQDKRSKLVVPIAKKDKEVLEGYLDELGYFGYWYRYYFVLKDAVLYRFPNKGEPQSRRTQLYRCTMDEYVPEDQAPDVPCTSFRIVTPLRETIILRGETLENMHHWCNNLVRQKLMIEEFIDCIVH